VIEGSKYPTHSVSDIQGALESVAMAEATPGVVISNLRLSGDLDGFQLVRRRHHETSGGTVSVIVTGVDRIDPDRCSGSVSKAATVAQAHASKLSSITVDVSMSRTV
jgi:hypothetical protein